MARPESPQDDVSVERIDSGVVIEMDSCVGLAGSCLVSRRRGGLAIEASPKSSLIDNGRWRRFHSISVSDILKEAAMFREDRLRSNFLMKRHTCRG